MVSDERPEEQGDEESTRVPASFDRAFRDAMREAMTVNVLPDGTPIKRHPNIGGPLMTPEMYAAMPEPLQVWTLARIRQAMQGDDSPPEIPFDVMIAQMARAHKECDCFETQITGPHCERCGEVWPCNGSQIVRYVTSPEMLMLPDLDDDNSIPPYMHRT